MRVVCTGKGSHRELFIQSFTFGGFAKIRGADNSLQLKPYDDWQDLHYKPLEKSYTFTCRRCNPVRETRMKAATLKVALSGLQAAGKATLDISALPF